MEMHQVRYFLATCEELNFTRAARACNVSQPSLTRAIKLLEHEFGGDLLRRERVNTHMTDLGIVVRPYLQNIWDQAEQAKLTAARHTSEKKMLLKLGVMCTLAPSSMIRLINAVVTRHPQIDLEVTDSPAQDLQERMIAGTLDAAIYCAPALVPDPRINCLKLFQEQMYVVLPATHRLAGNESIRIGELSGERYVLRTQCEHSDFIDGFFERLGVDCPTAYRSDRDDWVLAMVAAGLGFGLIGQNSIVQPMASSIAARPLVDPELWRVVHLATRRGRPYSAAVGALVHEAMRSAWPGGEALSVVERRSKPSERKVAS